MVILYSTGCPKCQVLKSKLDSKNISYELFDNKDKMIDKGFTNVPILEVDGEIMDFKRAVEWINKEWENELKYKTW